MTAELDQPTSLTLAYAAFLVGLLLFPLWLPLAWYSEWRQRHCLHLRSVTDPYCGDLYCGRCHKAMD